MSSFTPKERKRFRIKKYIKEHIFELFINASVNIVFVMVTVYLCRGTKYFMGLLLAVVYSLGRFIAEVNVYKKDYLDIEIK